MVDEDNEEGREDEEGNGAEVEQAVIEKAQVQIHYEEIEESVEMTNEVVYN